IFARPLAAPTADQATFAALPTSIEEDFQELAKPALAQPASATFSGGHETGPEDLAEPKPHLPEFQLDDSRIPPTAPAPGARKFADPLNLDDEFDVLHGADEGETQLELAQA